MENEQVKNKIRKQSIVIVILTIIILMIVFSAFKMNINDDNINRAAVEGYSSVEEDTGIFIKILAPVGWYNKDTNINIEVEDSKNQKIASVKAKIGEKGTWQDVTDDMYITISENATVYVKVIDKKGVETEKSRYIEIFDREKPTLSASVSGNMLRVEANDTISGIDVIFINGYTFDDLINDSLDVALYSFSEDENLRIQARDNAGNMSPVYTTKNPLFEQLKKEAEAKKKAEEEATKKAEEDKKASTTSQADGKASTTTAPSGTGETTSQADGSGDGTNNTGSAQSKESPLFGTFEDTNKQFMSIVTKDGKIFYMIIDHDREDENVYLLTEVTNSDLESFTEDVDTNLEDEDTPTDELIDGGKSSDELDLIIDPDKNDTSKNQKDTDGKSTSDTADEKNVELIPSEDGDNKEEEKEKKSPIPGYIVVAIIIFVIGFIAYMFLVFLPRKKADEYFEDDNEDYKESEDLTEAQSENLSSNYFEDDSVEDFSSEVGSFKDEKSEEYEDEEDNSYDEEEI